MPIRLKKREIAILNPEHVKAAQEALSTPGERPLKKKRLDLARHRLESGRFCRADFAYIDCKEDGQRYRINGNHTSTVLAECAENSDLPFPENCPLCVETWECDTIAELGDAFDCFDNPMSNRTSGERLIVHMREHRSELDGVDAIVVSAALKGVNMFRKMVRDENTPSVQQWELGELLSSPEVVQFCHFVQMFKDGSWAGWKDQGIAAVLFQSFLDDEDKARNVWEECFDEANDSETSASRRFVNRMRTEKGRRHRTPSWFYNQAKDYWLKQFRRAA